jgi:NitT/TauT family transport system ATP-binding protein
VLQHLWLERKFTCVLVTHDLREAAYLADTIFVMSARPGRIVATHRIEMPRPRTLDMTFDPKFIDVLHRIRGEIAKARNEVLGAQPASAKVT